MMKLYYFDAHSRDFGWKPVYAATEEEAKIAHGEYTKYAETPESVTPIAVLKFKTAADMCEHLNILAGNIW